MSALIERLIASRDRLRGFAVPSDDDIIEARAAMADACNALDAYDKTMRRIAEDEARSASDDYAQELITRLHERAESYRQSGPSAEHTAALLDEAAGAISALNAPNPRDDLIRRGDVVDTLAARALDHASLALDGEPENSRARQAAEAAFSAARYAVAFMPADGAREAASNCDASQAPGSAPK